MNASCTAGSTVAQVNTCINSLSDGGTINFATGSYSWNSAITMPDGKGVSLIGAGTGSSIVTIGSSGQVIYRDTITGTDNKLQRISGFTFQNAPSGSIPIWIYGRGTLTNLRIDHNTFSNLGTGSIAILLGATGGYGSIYGVIDNNSFVGTNNFMGMKLLGPGDDSAWRSSPKGTANNIFLENNSWVFTNASDLGSGCIDSWNSGSIVFRQNSLQNCLLTSHGVVHGGGTISFEVYDNSFIRTSGSGSWTDGTRLFHHQGSGETLLFNNQFTAVGTKSSGAIALTHYRSASPSAAGYSEYTRCDGTNTGDGNRSPQGTYYGYPCKYQPGRMTGNALSPMYFWNNRWTDTGAKIDVDIEDLWSGPPYVSTHILANRDYYNAVSKDVQASATSPFNGTAGMGMGTLSNRPATCTTNSGESGGGVGYWATDTNTLYRCSATNTWATHYRPYTYPHPMRGAGGVNPSPPQNFRIAP
jgi:hypothetical protein